MPRSLKTKSNTFSVCFIHKWKSDFVIQTDFIIFNCLLYTELLPILQIYGDVVSPSNTQLLGWVLTQYDQCLHKNGKFDSQPGRTGHKCGDAHVGHHVITGGLGCYYAIKRMPAAATS